MSVQGKIREVMKLVGNLSKDGQMQGQGNYKYLSEEKITSALHEACAKCGLVIVPHTMAVLDDRDDETSTGKILHNTRIAASYRIYDADDDKAEPYEGQVIGEGSDAGDKCLNKCMTAAYKYFLRQTFMISTGDDPDHEASQESAKSVRRPAPKKTGGNGDDPKQVMSRRIHALARQKFGDGEEALAAFKELKRNVLGEEVKTPNFTEKQATAVEAELNNLPDFAAS